MSTSLYAQECKYNLFTSTNTEKRYNNFTEFVTKEIRPIFQIESPPIIVNIEQDCSGKKINTNFTMDPKTFYIIAVNNQKLPKYLVDYNNRLALEVNRTNFDYLIKESLRHKFDQFLNDEEIKTYYDLKNKLYQQRILKMLAFVFAESARFESIQNTVSAVIDGDCSKDWHDFDFTVHNWRNMSDFVVKTNLLNEHQKKNNKGLVAPILIDQEIFFDKNLMDGSDYNYSKAAALIDNPTLFVCKS